MSLGNYKVINLKLIYHNEVPGELKEIRSAWNDWAARFTERLIIFGKVTQRKRWTKQLSLGNGEVMEIKLIKHDESLKDLAGQASCSLMGVLFIIRFADLGAAGAAFQLK